MDLLALLFGMRMESKLYQDGGTFYIPISSGSPVHYRIVCPFWLPVRALSGPNPDYLGYWVQLPTHNQKCEKRPQKWKIELIYNKAKLGGQLVHHPFPGRHWGTQMTEGAEQIWKHHMFVSRVLRCCGALIENLSSFLLVKTHAKGSKYLHL